MNKKEGFIRMAAATAIGFSTLNGCTEPNPSPISRPVITYTPEAGSQLLDLKEQAWRQLSPLERINRLEEGRLPDFRSFNLTKELVVATAQFYHQETNSPITPDEMVQNVSIKHPEQIASELENSLQIQLGPAQKKSLSLMRVIESEGKKVFINSDILALDIQTYIDNGGAVLLQLKGKDITTVYTKGMLFAAFSAINASKEKLLIKNPPVVIAVGNDLIEINSLNEFALFGHDTNTGENFVGDGARIAFDSYISLNIGTKSGSYTGRDTNVLAAGLVRHLNQKIKMDDEEFLDYYFGRKNAENFLIRIASAKDPISPDIKTSLQVLAVIGLCFDGKISSEDAKNRIDTLLTPSTFKPSVT
ncbi:MAG: hypothetical protein M1308_19675 [Actinobacteria bacterium]|nr:hypothetical protein [Actinomycetota bacterium]